MFGWVKKFEMPMRFNRPATMPAGLATKGYRAEHIDRAVIGDVSPVAIPVIFQR